MTNDLACDTLILLVGSNPLPNYLTAMTLKPKRVALEYSGQTEEPMKRLRGVLQDKGFTPIDELCVKATEAKDIYDKLKEFVKTNPCVTHLNYTGGTKTMAAHARMSFKDAGFPDGNASYLDEREALIRFDDGGTPLKLDTVNLELTIEVALALHGATFTIIPKSPRLADCLAIAAAVLNDHGDSPPRGPKLAARLYGLQRENGKKLSVTKANRVQLSELGLALSVDEFPHSDWTSREFTEYRDFLDGLWFEQWVEQIVRGIAGKKVHCNVECKRSDRKFELDVVVVRDHRVYVLSCTTDSQLERCKNKLFEVATRAAQIGGDLARSALACLLWDKDENGPFIDQVRSDMASLWESPNSPMVFGYENLKEWLGDSEIGKAADTSELAKWLES